MSATSWLTIAILLLGLITSLAEVWKDWDEQGVKKRRFRWWKLGLTAVGFPVGVLLVYLSSSEAVKSENAQKIEITGLRSAVETQTKSNETQYQRNQTELHSIGGQLVELRTEVATEELRKKITALQDQLGKSLAGGPKTALTFSFYPFTVSTDGETAPVTDVILPVGPDGIVHVDFVIANLTSIDAIDGDITLQICDGCKFAKQPEGFTRLAGQKDQEVYMQFAHIFAQQMLSTKSFDVVPPAKSDSFSMGMRYRCKTCILDLKGSPALVRLRRDTVRLPQRPH